MVTVGGIHQNEGSQNSRETEELARLALKEHNMKKCNNTKEDYISQLPDEILATIISCLGLRDAVRNNILSSKWRNACASLHWVSLDKFMVQLHFDGITNRTREVDCSPYREKFVQAVNQFIEFHRGEHIVFFRVIFCLGKDSAVDIDRWIAFAVKKGVEWLALCFCCCETCVAQKNGLYVFCPELLLGSGASKLKSLHLASCVLGPGLADQFSSLRRLQLTKVSLLGRKLNILFSSSLNLEFLMIKRCTLPCKVRVPSCLRCLSQLVIQFCPGAEEIRLCAPALEFFVYIGRSSKISYSNVPKLKSLKFTSNGQSMLNYIFGLGQLGKYLPGLHNLSVSESTTNWVKSVPENLTTFNKLNMLKLFFWRRHKFNSQKIILLLKACPNLQTFVLVTFCPSSSPEEITHQDADFVHRHLKIVELGGFHATKNHIEFAKYLLEHAVELEEMIIDPRVSDDFQFLYDVSISRCSWKEGERAKVCQQRLSRLSSKATVRIL